MSLIASPLVLRSGASIPNRLAKAAMSEVLGDPATGAPTDALVRLYERWGRSGAGLLLTGHVILDRAARPMTHTPDLPRRLLDGSLAAAPVVKVRSRLKLVDDALQALWFQAQIHELAQGREPDLALGKWTALWRGMRANFLGAAA